MLALKGCIRCGGDLEIPPVPNKYDDPTCIQCGFVADITSTERQKKINAQKQIPTPTED